MKEFLKILFIPIIELLSVRKKLKIADYRVKHLKMRLKQMQDCICEYLKYEPVFASTEKDLKSPNTKILLITLTSILLIISLITAAFIFKTKILTITTICFAILIFLISYYWVNKVLIEYTLQKLDCVKHDMQDIVNPNRMYERLGVDSLCIEVAGNLIPLVDPKQEGRILSLNAALRYRLTDTYGYIIPNIRIIDSNELNNNEYILSVRGHYVEKGIVYPGKVLINSKNIKEELMPLDKIKFDGDFWEDSSEWYWVGKSDAEKFNDGEKLEPDEVIIKHLEKIVMDYVDYIFDIEHVMKLVALADEQHLKMDEKKENWYILYYYFKENFDFAFVRKVLVVLLQRRISIKDIVFVLERTMEYSRITREPDEIALKIEHDIDYLKNNKKE